MIAQQEVKYRRPQGPSGQPAASKSSKKNQTPSQARNEKDSAKNGSQAASSPTEGQEEEPKGGAPAVKMTRDKIIGKFSKKKPAYSSCKMLSQVCSCNYDTFPINLTPFPPHPLPQRVANCTLTFRWVRGATYQTQFTAAALNTGPYSTVNRYLQA